MMKYNFRFYSENISMSLDFFFNPWNLLLRKKKKNWKYGVYKTVVFFKQLSNNFDFGGNFERQVLRYYFEGSVLACS